MKKLFCICLFASSPFTGALTSLVKEINELVEIGYPTGYPLWTRVALYINNHTSKDAYYYYSSKKSDGQTIWYKHTVKPNSRNWDWTWIYASTYDSIVIQSQSDKYPLWCNFTAIVLDNMGISNRWYLTRRYYTTFFNAGLWLNDLPRWNDKIWNVKYVDEYDYFDGYNFHTHFDIY